MIGRIRGELIEKRAPDVLLDVSGVGYELQVPMTTFYHLPEVGSPVCLYTHLVVREDAHQLFGFYQGSDRRLFRDLIKVNGVGPKLALAILSKMEAHLFVQCIMQDDVSQLVHIPGIGKKTAERLLIDLRDRLKDYQTGALSSVSHLVNNNDNSLQHNMDEAISALVALGYKPQQAEKAIKQIQSDEKSCEDMIRGALQLMV